MAESDPVIGAKSPQKGCVVDFDCLALDGVRGIHDVLRDRLQAVGIELTPVRFSRHLLGHSVERGLHALFASLGKGPAGETAQAVHTAYAATLAAAAAKPRPEAMKLVRELAARNVQVGLMTQLPEESAKALLGDLLAVGNVQLICETHGWIGGFAPDAWGRAVRRMQMTDRLCAGVTVSGFSTKGALAAGLGVVAVTHELTAHQDYSGADLVLDAWSGDILKTLLVVLRVLG